MTRRLGWKFLRAGEILTGVEKAQGLKKGEKIVKLGRIRVISAKRELLTLMVTDPIYGYQEVAREGFPDLTPDEFVAMFCEANNCRPDTTVTRIEFEYL